MQGGRCSISPPCMGVERASLCSPWSPCRLYLLQLCVFAASCSIRPHMSSGRSVGAGSLPCTSPVPDALCGGTVTDPRCWVWPWARRVGSSSLHGRLLDVSSAWGMPGLQQSNHFGTMSCKRRTPGLREGDCPSEPSCEPGNYDAPPK